MGHLKYTPYLTTGYAPDVAAKIKKTHAGMAYFADTGPFAATCAECEFYGAWKRKRNAAGEIIGTAWVNGACEKSRELTGKLGPAFPSNAAACKYLSRKKEDENRNQNQDQSRNGRGV
jgi:hypothetical protein